MTQIIAVGIGGFLGAIARHGISSTITKYASGPFFWGTLSVNIIGSFCMGLMAFSFQHKAYTDPLRLFIAVGFLGALTTFSTYSLEAVSLFKSGNMKLALLHIVAHNVTCISCVMLGWFAMKGICR